MKILENEKLDKYTTFKMGGTAKKMYFPESIDELLDLANSDPDILKYLIGGGSNLIINDDKNFEKVVSLKDFNNQITKNKDNTIYIGASVRLQKAINEINKLGYGGIEYLFSVPGLIGGAIYMNAGRGRKHNKSISDYIIKVDYIENGKICSINKEDCKFQYRNSIFQTKKCIIVGALFRFDKVSADISAEKKKERIELCKKVEDFSAPNFGTVFCESNKYIMAFVRKIGLGTKKGIHFSYKTKNWLLHGQDGNFIQTMKVLNKVEKIHHFFRKKCRLEVKVWK